MGVRGYLSSPLFLAIFMRLMPYLLRYHRGICVARVSLEFGRVATSVSQCFCVLCREKEHLDIIRHDFLRCTSHISCSTHGQTMFTLYQLCIDLSNEHMKSCTGIIERKLFTVFYEKTWFWTSKFDYLLEFISRYCMILVPGRVLGNATRLRASPDSILAAQTGFLVKRQRFLSGKFHIYTVKYRHFMGNIPTMHLPNMLHTCIQVLGVISRVYGVKFVCRLRKLRVL